MISMLTCNLYFLLNGEAVSREKEFDPDKSPCKIWQCSPTGK